MGRRSKQINMDRRRIVGFLVIAVAGTVRAMANLEGAISFFGRMFPRRQAAYSMKAEPGSYVITLGTGSISLFAYAPCPRQYRLQI